METTLVYAKGAKALTNSILVAKKFNKEHKHVLDAIRELIKGCAENSADPMFAESTYIHPQNGQEYPMYVMNRDGFTLLAMGFNGDKALRFKLDYIKAFNKMEEHIRNPYQINETHSNPQLSYVQTQLYLADALAERLRLNEASRLGIYQSIAEPYNLRLPQYVQSKGVLKSASVLLKDNGYTISVIRFNQLLEKYGYVETISRPAGNGKVRKFKNITEKGKEYGENEVNPKNQKETQPHWYVDRFAELYNKVTA